MSHKIILTEEQINNIKELSKTLSRKQISQKLNISISKVNQVFNPPLTKEEFINKYGQEAWNKKQLKKKQYDKQYRLENKEYRNKQTVEYWKQHREEQRSYRRQYDSIRKQRDLNFKLSRALRARINGAIKSQKTTKDLHMLDLLGCSIEQCRKYIEKQFTNEMNWDNHGRIWHIDHIIPCSYFDLNNEENLKICFNYKNLQPLLIKENLSKSDKLPRNLNTILHEIKESL